MNRYELSGSILLKLRREDSFIVEAPDETSAITKYVDKLLSDASYVTSEVTCRQITPFSPKKITPVQRVIEEHKKKNLMENE